MPKTLGDFDAPFLIAFGLGTILTIGWFAWYVQPREEFLLAVAECTGEDSSEAAWKRCSGEVRERLSDPDAPKRQDQ